MSHAVVLQVQLGGDAEADLRMLNEQVIPHAKAQSGFQKGIWMRSADNRGLGIVVFDTEENANGAAPGLKPPPDTAPLISCTVYEVGGEA